MRGIGMLILIRKAWHRLCGCRGTPDNEGQVYCAKCGKFIFG